MSTLSLDMPPAVLATVLTAISEIDDSRDLNRKAISVPVHRILATAWNPGRLARCTELLAEGRTTPPVHLVRYKLAGLNWYVVSDGHHRTVAARNAGRKRIRAVVGCETPCRPERYLLRDGRLWRKVVDARFGHCLQLVPVDIDEELAGALAAVGVEGTP